MSSSAISLVQTSIDNTVYRKKVDRQIEKGRFKLTADSNLSHKKENRKCGRKRGARSLGGRYPFMTAVNQYLTTMQGVVAESTWIGTTGS
jgi:hypothetical protein